MGIKDNEGASYTPSSVVEISEYEYLNSNAYTQKFKVLYSYASKSLPTNPTHPNNWRNLRYQKWNGEDWQTVGAVPETWYDCSTWGTVYTGLSYRYYGYKKSSGSAGTEKTKTFLIRGESTAMQNFAFEMEE